MTYRIVHPLDPLRPFLAEADSMEDAVKMFGERSIIVPNESPNGGVCDEESEAEKWHDRWTGKE
jgi:hypothetical protein